MEEKDTDFTKEENVELNSVYLKRNIAIAVCLVLYIAIFLGCGAWIRCRASLRWRTGYAERRN